MCYQKGTGGEGGLQQSLELVVATVSQEILRVSEASGGDGHAIPQQGWVMIEREGCLIMV